MQEQDKPSGNQPTTTSAKAAMGVWRNIRRVFVTIAGVTVILIGIVLLVTPGPAMLVIPIGLAILATEYVWAKRLLRRVKESAVSATSAACGKGNESSAAQSADPNASWWTRLTTRLKETSRAAVAPFRTGYIDSIGTKDNSNPAARLTDKSNDA